MCTVLIVLLHAYEESLLSASNHCSFYVAKFLSMGISQTAVPFFFIISGFLLACQYDGGIPYSQLVKKRFISLGKPYVYWCILYALAYLLFAFWGNHLSGRALTENTWLA
ncbi:MAG: acyltransferase family protein, partial [Victivallales bacterium]|nr:acyltransferase family protein [Victivallales bacterium]